MTNEIQTETAPKKKSKRVAPIILGTVLLVGIIFGIKEYIYYSHIQNTDDAQVASNIDPVVTRITDYVTDINFQDNQPVTKGQVLVKLDDKDLVLKEQQAEADLANVQANVAVAKANAESIESSVATAKGEIDAAQINVWKTQQDFDRYQNLLKDGSITQEQFDNAKAAKESAATQADIAQKKYESAQKQAEVAQANLSSAQTNVAIKQSAIDYAKLQLSYAVITAPSSGKASKRGIQLGQLVQAGSPLLAIVEDSVWIEANFKETQMNDMKVGQTADIQIDAYDDKVITGTISSFAGATGTVFSLLPPDNAAGNFVKVVQRMPVKIVLDTKNELYKQLRPGLSVEVTVKVK
ncbi:MAG TPA: HlyD family secretion protein [Bacteroidia bacterium]|nr:HlyD family secretion protein [Bacteroidia bacterium]